MPLKLIITIDARIKQHLQAPLLPPLISNRKAPLQLPPNAVKQKSKVKLPEMITKMIKVANHLPKRDDKAVLYLLEDILLRKILDHRLHPIQGVFMFKFFYSNSLSPSLIWCIFFSVTQSKLLKYHPNLHLLVAIRKISMMFHQLVELLLGIIAAKILVSYLAVFFEHDCRLSITISEPIVRNISTSFTPSIFLHSLTYIFLSMCSCD